MQKCTLTENIEYIYGFGQFSLTENLPKPGTHSTEKILLPKSTGKQPCVTLNHLISEDHLCFSKKMNHSIYYMKEHTVKNYLKLKEQFILRNTKKKL